MNIFRTLISLSMLLLSACLQGQSLKLVLVDTIRMQQLKTDPLKWDNETEGNFLQDPEPAFGFLAGGKLVYFGKGGWIYDMETRKLEKRFPDTLYWPILSADGSLLFGTLKEQAASPWGGRFVCFNAVDGKQVPVKWEKALYPKYSALHPNNRVLTWADWKDRTGGFYDALHFTDLSTGQVWKAGGSQWGDNIDEVCEFTGDGRYLVIQGENSRASRLMELKTFHMLPEDSEKDGYLFNRDASWMAGKRGANDWSTFVWDRVGKRFLWKDAMVSEPSAFSPNDKFLYCCDTVNDASTGKAVFENLKGTRGKFSPDGRSLVTVDKEAFYVYTLPKDSEPIFGVFQKPKPWSPVKSVK